MDTRSTKGLKRLQYIWHTNILAICKGVNYTRTNGTPPNIYLLGNAVQGFRRVLPAVGFTLARDALAEGLDMPVANLMSVHNLGQFAR